MSKCTNLGRDFVAVFLNEERNSEDIVSWQAHSIGEFIVLASRIPIHVGLEIEKFPSEEFFSLKLSFVVYYYYGIVSISRKPVLLISRILSAKTKLYNHFDVYSL